LPSNTLKNVVVFCNFTTVEQTITPDFPYTGVWYNLMDPTGNSTLNVSNTTTLIGLQAGQFKIYGNQPGGALSTPEFLKEDFTIIPNPVTSSFKINKAVTNIKVIDITGKLIKEFVGDFGSNITFDISKLPQSMDIIQVTNSSGQQETTKLVKL
jgi:hypothetical protein